MAERLTCQKCGKTMDEKQFYTYKSGEKTELCKKCLTMHIDAFDASTYLWLLEKMDVPYLPWAWNATRDKEFAKNPNNIKNDAVFGKYLSKMKIKPYNICGWADTGRLQEEHELTKTRDGLDPEFEAEMKEKYEAGEISEAQYRTLVSTEVQNADVPLYGAPQQGSPQSFFNEADYISEEELPDPTAELTTEDKIYLAMKWGRVYKPSEWIELERQYEEMNRSFDIQDADTSSTLILICKTYLKMNQAIDIGDMEGYQKLSRVYDSLRKSAKFTAAQNKAEKADYVDSVGELVAMCEREGGFIPRFATDIPQDKVDATLKDMNGYVYKLVTQDLGFGQQIEDALRKIQIQKEMEEAEDALENPEDAVELEDIDYEEYYEDIEEQRLQDSEMMAEE